MIPNIDILEEELTEREYASNTYQIVNVEVYETLHKTIRDKGRCGDNVTWELFKDGVLRIHGEGDTYDYTFDTVPFANNENIKVIIIETGVTGIGNQIFRKCATVEKITISHTVTKIGNYAFGGCNSLTSITLPDSVTQIGKYAFTECINLSSISMPNSVTSDTCDWFRKNQSLTSVTIPNGIKTLSEFYNCSSLTSIVIPDTVTYIKDSCFNKCDNLTNVYYKGTETQWNEIKMGQYSGTGLNATIHYNYVEDNNTTSDTDINNYISHPNPTCSDYLDRINGYVDDMDAIKQAIYLILSIERYKHVIYSWDYGVELLDLYGKPLPYVMADLPRRIKEALTQDDRIEDVTDFEFEKNGKRLHATFTVVTNAGNITTDLEVEV